MEGKSKGNVVKTPAREQEKSGNRLLSASHGNVVVQEGCMISTLDPDSKRSLPPELNPGA